MSDNALTMRKILQSILYAAKDSSDESPTCSILLDGETKYTYYTVFKVDKDIVWLKKGFDTSESNIFIKIDRIVAIDISVYEKTALNNLKGMMADLSAFT